MRNPTMKPMFLTGVEESGVPALSEEAHRQGGKRMASAGYVPVGLSTSVEGQ